MTINEIAPQGADVDRVDVDVASAEFNDTFDETTTKLLKTCPVAHTPVGWLLTKHSDVRSAATDWRTFSSSSGTHPWMDGSHFRPTGVDPPRHDAFRRPFLSLFAPQALVGLEDAMRERTRKLIDGFRADGRCEIATQFSRKFIGGVFFENLLGLDGEMAEALLDSMYRFILPPFHEDALREYDDLVELAMVSAQNGSVTSAVFEAVLGLEENGEPVSWEEKRSTLGILIIGGLETTVSSINTSVLHLAQHPDLLRRLVENPELMAAAVEESLRLYTPVFTLSRRVMCDVEVRGTAIAAGDQVLLGWGAASHDPEVFTDPMTFDLDRPAQPHLAFGAGIHRCIGAHLARMEIRIALEELLCAIPIFTLAPGTEIHWHTSSIRSVEAMPIVF